MKRSEIPAYIAAKPLAKMRRLAAILGWNGLEIDWVYAVTEFDEVPTSDTPIAVYYITPDEEFDLQINECPLEQSVSHRATVKVDRYRIGHAKWFDFELPADRELTPDEIDQMRSLLQRSNYRRRSWVRAIKATDRVRAVQSKKKRRGKRR